MPPLFAIGLLMDLAEMSPSKFPTGSILTEGAHFPNVRTLKHLVTFRQAPGKEKSHSRILEKQMVPSTKVQLVWAINPKMVQ